MSATETFQNNELVQVLTDVPEWVILSISPQFQSKADVTGFFRKMLADLPDNLCEALILAIDELLGNAIEHGCKLDPNCWVEMSLLRTARLVLIEISDGGSGFAIENVEHAAVNNPPGDPLRHSELRCQMGMRPGGFGIMLAKQVADELIYNQYGNRVALIKYL